MKVKTILAATDFSPSSEAALECATALARGFNASLLIVHIAPSDVLPGADGDVFDPLEPSLHEKLKSVRPTDARVAHEHHFGHGIPSHAIVHLAEHADVGLIVMGAHGETGRKNELMGEVARRVVLDARCPVLTVNTVQTTAPVT